MNRISLLALVAAATSASAATIFVDNFTVAGSVQVTVDNLGGGNPPSGTPQTFTNASYSGTIFGGYRTLSLQANKNGSPAASLTVTANSGYVQLTSANSTSTYSVVKWAGANGTGIAGGVDIVNQIGGGTSATTYLHYQFIDATKGASIEWILTDTTGKTATWSNTYAASTTDYVESVVLSDFTPASGFNWSKVSSIQLVDKAGGGYGIKYQNIYLSDNSSPGTPTAPSGITPPVPEPSTYGIVLGGLALVGAVIRRRKQAK